MTYSLQRATEQDLVIVGTAAGCGRKIAVALLHRASSPDRKLRLCGPLPPAAVREILELLDKQGYGPAGQAEPKTGGDATIRGLLRDWYRTLQRGREDASEEAARDAITAGEAIIGWCHQEFGEPEQESTEETEA